MFVKIIKCFNDKVIVKDFDIKINEKIINVIAKDFDNKIDDKIVKFVKVKFNEKIDMFFEIEKDCDVKIVTKSFDKKVNDEIDDEINVIKENFFAC